MRTIRSITPIVYYGNVPFAERARVEELEKDLLRRALAENEGVVAPQGWLT